MNYKDLDIKISYHSQGPDNIVEAFINPAQDGSNVIKMDFRPIHSGNEAEGEEKE